MRSPSEVPPVGASSPRSVLTRASLTPRDLEVDLPRARELLAVLYQRFLAEHETAATITKDAPQWKYRPEAMEFGSIEHQIWLFFAASTDLRSESADVYRTHRLFWENKRMQLCLEGSAVNTRELYLPAVLGWDDPSFTSTFTKALFGNPNRNMTWWRRKARTLWDTWGGEPQRMFARGGVDALMAWKQSLSEDPIPGIGPKIASLIAIFLEELGMPHVHDAFPVDIHVQRLMLALRIVVPKREGAIMNDTLEALLRPMLVRLCDEAGWSRIILSHALWFQGNRLCSRCWKTPYMQEVCPVFTACQGAYLSRPYFKMGLWIPMDGPMAKGGVAPLVPFSERPLFGQAGS